MSKYDDYYQQVKNKKNGEDTRRIEKEEKNKKALKQAHIYIELIVNDLYNRLLNEMDSMIGMGMTYCKTTISSNYLNTIYFHLVDEITYNIMKIMNTHEASIIEELNKKIRNIINKDKTTYQIEVKWGDISKDYSNINNEETDIYNIEYHVIFKFII